MHRVQSAALKPPRRCVARPCQPEARRQYERHLSNHLACLRGCGLVVGIPEGRHTRHELADGRLAHALGDLLGLILAVDPACTAPAGTDH
ncbi:ArsR/SmtB family transcription factor [Plantactinospora sp. WMMC1484]|uniref:ArsR/SmtB family transcription factor n=1 Tax=Plantactinospora sp. WMMC1484 TaxID=3404122 RepID=UPI003BF579FA